MLRCDLRSMKVQISKGETNHKKVLTDVDGKITLRLGWLKKLVPLQQAFEEELHKKANAKKRSYDETDGNAFDFDEDVAAASQEEQLKDRNRKEQERFEKGKPDKRKPHRWDQNLGYKPVMPRSSRPGGLFLDHAQKKNAEPGARGRILLERAERSRAERSRAGSGDVFEQSAPYQPSGRSAGATGRGQISTEFESLPPRRSLARRSQLAAASRKARRTASGGLRLPRRLIPLRRRGRAPGKRRAAPSASRFSRTTRKRTAPGRPGLSSLATTTCRSTRLDRRARR